MSSRIPIQVLVYPVRRRKEAWEFLLLKRIEERGGFWQGVTGAPEEGEGILDGARRELLEETGYTPKQIIQTDFSYTIDVKDVKGGVYPKGVKEIPEYVFIAIISTLEEPVIDASEHTQWKWCVYGKALELLYWENNREALSHVHSELEKF
jgi:8-oxo-dGTP pyrophosphatase MutT (NUDIX family)